MRYGNRKQLNSHRRIRKNRSGRRLLLESLDQRLVLTGAAVALAPVEAEVVAETLDRQAALTLIQAEGEGTMMTSRLTIFENGQRVTIPANIGVNADTSTANVFTDTADGTLQSMSAATLGDFFDIWRTDAGLAGNNPDAVLSGTQLLTNIADTSNTVQMFVDGQISAEFDNHVLQGGEEIILVYSDNPVVSLNTNFGPIVVELFESETPGTVANFLNYVNDGDYINSFFHRSATFSGAAIIQGGGFSTTSNTFTNTAQFTSVPTDAPIQNEPGISNVRGTIAMAKTSDPDSATSQFFVNLNAANTLLDDPNNSGGFTVFGQVLDLRSSDEIRALPVNTSNGSPYSELPLSAESELAVIESIVGRGEITGIHFNDDNRNGSLDPGESGISGGTIYIDANDNGVVDPGEFSTTTDADGRYLFQVDPGSYTVRAEYNSSLNLTVPSSADSYSVTVEIGREAAGRDFGVAQLDNVPVAQVDSYSIDEGDVLTVTTANGVLANDTSQTSASLTASVNTQPANGSLTLSSDGSLVYTPNANFFGTDAFTYTASDGTNQSSPTAVTVTVNALAGDDNSLSGFVYIDADGNGIRDTGEVGVPGAQITLTGAGVTQSILTNSMGAYSFTALPAGTYQLVERQPTALHDGTDSTTVPNAVVGNDQITAIALANGQDFAENNFGEMGIQSQYLGIAWFFARSDSHELIFRETIAMGEEMGGDAALAATIRAGGTEVPDGTNSAPIVNGDTFSVNQNAVLTVPVATGVLSNDTDLDGDSLTAVVLTQPANGTLSFSGDGSFTYTPEGDFFGTNTFTYQASDGTSLSNAATVTITVNEVDSTNTFTLPENSAVGTVVGQVTPTSDLGSDVVFTFDDPTLAPELEFAADDHITGNPAGAVVLIEYLDFECPVCRTFHPIVEQLEQNFPDDLVVVSRHLPLTSIHPNAFVAAVAAEAAGRQGAFDAFGDLLFENQEDWDGGETDPQSFFEDYATQLGLDLTQFRADQADPALATRVARDADAAAALGAAATPTFFLNGERITNPGNQAAFDAVIQAEVDQIDDVFRLNRQTGEIIVADSAALDFETTPSFSLTVNAIGLDGASEEINVRIDLTNVNEVSPVAVTDSYSVNENETLTVTTSLGVLNNDSVGDGGSLSATQVTGPTSGSLSLNADGSFTYTPNANFNGTDTFTYSATDGTLTSAAATVTITIDPVNSAPLTAADSYTLEEDSSLTVAAANGVLINDSDPEASTLTAVLVEAPQNGTLTLNADGSFTYMPAANFSGTDAFTYAASDGELTSGATTVTLLVQGLEDTPVGVDDSYSVDQAGILNVSVANGVLANDSDADADTLTALLLSNPANGSLTLNANGAFSYDPNDTFVGTDTFTYQASDGFFVSNTVTVTITVNDINVAPATAADNYFVDEDNVLNVNATDGLLANDEDPDGDSLTIAVTSSVSNGMLDVQDDGSFTYTPDPNFNGTDTFTYRLNDGTADSNTSLVTIVVDSIGDLPATMPDEYSVPVDGSLTVDAANGVLANDSDVDGDSLTSTVMTTTSNGTLSLQSDGSFTYTPVAAFHGTDSFTYTANDGSGDSSETTVTIAVNTVATTIADAYAVNEDETLTIDAAAGVLDNDSDVDNDTLTAAIVTAPANGVVTMNGDGSFEYQPDDDFNGTDSFSYVANDGFGDSTATLVAITVNPVNDAPVANDNEFTTPVGQALTISTSAGVLENDVDVDGDSLTAALQSSPAHGSVVLNDDGSFTYTPDAAFHGTDTFTYLSSDGTVDSNEATVTIAVNNAALALDDNYSIDEDNTLSIDVANGVLDNDNNVDGDALTASVVSQPSHGQLMLNADGSFSYTPNSDFTGTDSFAYVANDGIVDSAAAIVTITVNGVNDAPQVAADQYSVAGESSIVVDTNDGVLANDSDAEGDSLTASLVNGTIRGALEFNANGSFTYTPNSSFSGTDSFVYEVSDGALTSTTATVTITVTPVDLVRIRLEAAADDGTPLEMISVGESFALNAFVEDIRRLPQGVFAAYFDVVYDSSIASVDGPISYSSAFANGQSGSTATPGLIDEVGAFTQSTLGGGAALLFSVPFVASSAGTLDLAIEAADLFPAHDTLLRGIDNAISIEFLDFVGDSLVVTSAPGGEGEGSGSAEYAASVDEAFAAEDNWLLP